MKLVTCNGCGWVHMGYTRAQAQAEVDHFNDYFKTLSKEKQDDYYGGEGASIAQYETCWCGSTSFRPTRDGDCPVGVTIGPVIAEGV
jgi:hypothetical protein